MNSTERDDRDITLSDALPQVPLWPGDESEGGSGFGRYQDLEEIGRGGMGVILQGTDPDLGRTVALKVLQAGPAADRLRVARFLREARITGQLEHPNIVPVHEVSIAAGGDIFFSMKRVRGRSLAERLADGDPTEPARRRQFLVDLVRVCDALAYAHARGVVHRDLKPANIMIGQFGEVLVMDWGIARVRGAADADPADGPGELELAVTDGERTAEGSVLGTPRYMSPEQIEAREDLDARSDIYSLGAILYDVLTGGRLHAGRSNQEVLTSVVIGDSIEPPTAIAPGAAIARELESVVLRAMARRPADRYPDVEAFQADLEAHLAGTPLAAASYGPGELLVKWVRRHQAISAISAAAVALLLVALGVVVWQIDQRRQAAESARSATRSAHAETEAAHAETQAAHADLTAEHERATDLLAEALEREGRDQLETRSYQQAAIFLAASLAIRHDAARRGLALDALQRTWPCRPLALEAGPVLELTWAPIGRRLAVVTEQGAWIVDPSSGQANRFSSAARGVTWSPDGSLLAGFVGGQGIEVWTAGSGQRRWNLAVGLHRPDALAWARRGTTLAVGTVDGTVALHDGASGERLSELEAVGGGAITCLSWSPGDALLAGRLDAGGIVVWNPATGRLRYRLESPPHETGAIAWSPDGQRIVSEYEASTHQVWDLEAGRAVATIDRHELSALHFSPDGRHLVGQAAHDTVQLWETDGFNVLSTLGNHEEKVADIAFSPDGSILVTASHDRTIRTWRADEGELLETLHRHRGRVDAIAWAPDGRTFASGDLDGEILLWERPSGLWSRRVATGPIDPTVGALSPDGRRAAVVGPGGGLRIVDLAAPGDAGPIAVGDRRAVAWSPDGDRLALAGPAGTAVVEAATGRASIRRAAAARAVAWSNDGRRLAVVEGEGAIVVVDLAGEVVERRAGSAVAWAPGGRLVVAGTDRVEVGDRPIALEGSASIERLLVSPDGRRLAGIGETIGVWDLASGRLLESRTGAAAAWRADSSLVVATGRHLDLGPGRPEAASEEPIRDLALSPSLGLILVETDRCLEIRDAQTGLLLVRHERPPSRVAWLAGDRAAPCLIELEAGGVRIWDRRAFLGSAEDLLIEAERRTAYRIEGLDPTPVGR